MCAVGLRIPDAIPRARGRKRLSTGPLSTRQDVITQSCASLPLFATAEAITL